MVGAGQTVVAFRGGAGWPLLWKEEPGCEAYTLYGLLYLAPRDVVLWARFLASSKDGLGLHCEPRWLSRRACSAPGPAFPCHHSLETGLVLSML